MVGKEFARALRTLLAFVAHAMDEALVTVCIWEDILLQKQGVAQCRGTANKRAALRQHPFGCAGANVQGRNFLLVTAGNNAGGEVQLGLQLGLKVARATAQHSSDVVRLGHKAPPVQIAFTTFRVERPFSQTCGLDPHSRFMGGLTLVGTCGVR